MPSNKFRGVELDDPPDIVDNAEVRSHNYAGMRNPNAPAAGGPVSNPSGWQQFASPDEGVAAILDQLGRYHSGKTTGKPLTTLREIISTWAPPSENQTDQLISRASTITGFKPDEKLDFKNPETLSSVTEAMIRNEQGGKLPVHPFIINTLSHEAATGKLPQTSPSDPVSAFFGMSPNVDPTAPAGTVPPPAPAGTPPLSYTVTPTLGPGAAATQTAEAGIVPDLYKQHLGFYSGNQQAIQNLRNAAEIATHITTGVSIPAQTELGRWATSMGLKPEYFGLEKPEYVQEARKAALMAMYATFQGKNPGLVADLESRHGVIPDPELEPGAFKALIAQGLSTMNYQNDWYKHMEEYKKDKGKGSILGYDPTAFPSQANTAVYLKDAYSSLPHIKGEKEPWIIGQPSSSSSPVPSPQHTIQPTPEAIGYLKANPNSKNYFESTYGPGTAAQYLK